MGVTSSPRSCSCCTCCNLSGGTRVSRRHSGVAVAVHTATWAAGRGCHVVTQELQLQYMLHSWDASKQCSDSSVNGQLVLAILPAALYPDWHGLLHETVGQPARSCIWPRWGGGWDCWLSWLMSGWKKISLDNCGIVYRRVDCRQ